MSNGEQAEAFFDLTMSGTVVSNDQFVIVGGGDIGGVQHNFALRLTQWQIGYLAERLEAFRNRREPRGTSDVEFA